MPTGVLAAATMYTGGSEGFSCGTPLGVAMASQASVRIWEKGNTREKQMMRLQQLVYQRMEVM